MKLQEFNTIELSKNELQSIDGGIVFATAACIFAIGVCIGAGIGIWNTKR